MTPTDLTLIRALIRDVRAHFDGRGISGPMALRLADACEMLMRDHMRDVEFWKEEARRYANNATYWHGRATNTGSDA